jgi:ADP-ribosylglycohydrolase
MNLKFLTKLSPNKQTAPPSLKERVLGGLYGLLIGDALGVPYEFHSPEDIPKMNQIEYKPPYGFKRSHPSVLPGTWSDDGAQALCLLHSLLTCGRFEIDIFAICLLKWLDSGLFAVDNKVFDVGDQTARALAEVRDGKSPLESGNVIPEGKGNGSLMRVLPLALCCQGSDEKLVYDAHRQSLVTHGHICNQVCCALYCLWTKRLLQGNGLSEAYDLAVSKLRKIYCDGSKFFGNSECSKFFSNSECLEFYNELQNNIRPNDPPTIAGGGYVVDTLRSVRMILISGNPGNYEQAVKSAIALGHDTDTTAAIAGGLAGIFFGVNDIPKRWREKLRGEEITGPLVNGLLRVSRL